MANKMSDREKGNLKELLAASIVLPDADRQVLLNLAHDMTLIHRMGYELTKANT